MNVLTWSNAQVLTYFAVLTRLTSLLFFFPILGDKSIPIPVKILLGVALSFVIFPFVWAMHPEIDDKIFYNTFSLMACIAMNTLLGAIVGYISRWVFDAIQTAGSFIATSLGYSMASVMDPHIEAQTTAFAELQYILCALLFLALNGHHLYIVSIAQSFKEIPISGAMNLSSDNLMRFIVGISSDVLVLAVKLSAPILVLILLVNMAFGILARAVPHLNVFVISFGVNLMVGCFVFILCEPGFLNLVQNTFDSYEKQIFELLRVLGHKGP